MNKSTKIWLIVATSLVLIGCIIFGSMMMALDWDFTKLSTVNYETNNHLIDEKFSDISVKSDTADIVFTASEDESCHVVCYEEEKITHNVVVKDDTLIIELVDSRNWYDHIGLFSRTPKITVYLPDGQYGILSIDESTGDIDIPREFSFEAMNISLSTGDVTSYASASHIRIATTTGDIYTENIAADAVDLSVSTGKVAASSIACKGDLRIQVSTGDALLTDTMCSSFISTGDTGDIMLKNVTAKAAFSIVQDTGDVTFEDCDAAEIFVKTDTGDVTGSLRNEKVFITQTNTGKVDIPQSTNGGKCEIITDTGDIEISVE